MTQAKNGKAMMASMNFHEVTKYRIGPVDRVSNGAVWRDITIFSDGGNLTLTLFAKDKDPDNVTELAVQKKDTEE